MNFDKLYYRDSFTKTFTAEVISCEKTDKGWAVILSDTAFYPEGGGQPADHGRLGNVNVFDVREKNDEVIHYTDGPLEAGTTVEGHIDWARRYDHMQQHSGEHMISGLICSRYHCDNVGFHMGTDVVTIDFSAEIPEEDLPELENTVNAAILEDLPITEAYPSPEVLEATEYRSKIKINGAVRLVNAAGMDLCACCGTHMKTTGQIGGIRLLSSKRYKGGSRLELLCGMRIQKHHRLLYLQNESISRQLSAKPLETAAAVARLKVECDDMKRNTAAVWDRYFALKAASLPEGSIAIVEEGAGMDELRRCCTAASEGRDVFAAFAPEEGGFKFAIVSSGSDIRELTKEMNKALNGSGGGKPTFTQGRVKCSAAELRDFMTGKDIKPVF